MKIITLKNISSLNIDEIEFLIMSIKNNRFKRDLVIKLQERKLEILRNDNLGYIITIF